MTDEQIRQWEEDEIHEAFTGKPVPFDIKKLEATIKKFKRASERFQKAVRKFCETSEVSK